MAVDRTYRCNLCREKPRDDLVGLHWQSWPKGWIEKPAHQTKNHICMPCLSSLQAMPMRCGQGFACEGGPTCGSDHK